MHSYRLVGDCICTRLRIGEAFQRDSPLNTRPLVLPVKLLIASLGRVTISLRKPKNKLNNKVT